MAYRDDIAEDSFGVLSVTIKESPIRMYLTAERALNRNDSGAYLYWKTGLHRVETSTSSDPNTISDERGRVIRLGFNYVGVESGFLGWIREDELNVPLEIVTLRYHTLRREDIGSGAWSRLAELYDVDRWVLRRWNPQYSPSLTENHIGQRVIVEKGFPQESGNLFEIAHLDNRYQNAVRTDLVSVQLSAKPNTRYDVTTNIPKHPTNDTFEFYADAYPSSPDDLYNGVSDLAPRTITTTDTGLIELTFMDKTIEGVNVGYQNIVSGEYWVAVVENLDAPIVDPPIATMEVNGVIYPLYEGDNMLEGFKLPPGTTEVNVIGDVTVAFHYQKEVMG